MSARRGESTLVMLTLNEIEGVRALFDKIPFDQFDESLVVDAGSTDGTVEFFEEREVRVIPQDIKGRGEAFRIAAREAKGHCLVFFSPDGNEDPNDIPKLLVLLDEGYDMAIASRFLPGARNEEDGDYLPLRKWTNQLFTLSANWLWNRGPYVTDTINGFRGITRTAFEILRPESVGYTIEFEMTIRAMKRGLRVVEIPTWEGDRVGGATKGPSFRIGWDFLGFFVREIFRGK